MTSPLHNLQVVTGGLVYETNKARTVAYSLNLDGISKFLMVTRRGNFFLQFDAFREGPGNRLLPLNKTEAIRAFNVLEDHAMTAREAFPDMKMRAA